MPDDIKISELTPVSALNNGDLVEVSQVDALAETGYTSMRASMTDLANKFNKDMQYASDLQTLNKTVIGSINELLAAIADVADDIPENSDFSLSGLSDTAINNPSANQILQYSSNKWQNKAFTLANLTDTTISSPSSGQVLSYNGSKWVNTSTPTTITITKGSSMPSGFPTPNVSRRGNVCIVNFAIQIPAGTYSSDDTLWNITPVPITNTRCMVSFSANSNKFTNLNLLTSGKIAFNGTQTVESDSWLIGQAVYLTDG